jgi:hypothetical protein
VLPTADRQATERAGAESGVAREGVITAMPAVLVAGAPVLAAARCSSGVRLALSGGFLRGLIGT